MTASEYDEMVDTIDGLTTRLAYAMKLVRKLSEYIPLSVTACHGDKCREPHCESCMGTEYALEYVQENEVLHKRVLDDMREYETTYGVKL